MPKTRGNKPTLRKSRRRKESFGKGLDNSKKSHIVRMFLEMLNVLKIYHWKTRSFAQHKATDELYGRLNDHIDTFIEVLLGKDQSRIKMVERSIQLMDPSEKTDFQNKVLEYRGFLTDMNIYFDPAKDTDLLNIRDEILGDINQFLYLMTFDK
jgi:hypothetical protein